MEQDFTQILVVGVAISLSMEFLRSKVGRNPELMRFVVVLASIAAGTVYWFLRDTNLWQTILGILGSASTFYAVFLKVEGQIDEEQNL